MTGGGGKDLATQGLGLIAKGLTEALGELKELGMVGEAGAGRGFGDIALSGLELGHEGLTDEFTSFCERWEWGVRSLINEGNGFAARTGLAAGTYYETDQYVDGTFTRAGHVRRTVRPAGGRRLRPLARSTRPGRRAGR